MNTSGALTARHVYGGHGVQLDLLMMLILVILVGGSAALIAGLARL